MPRKPILDIPKKEIACALARAGMTGRWIAAFFGVDESTLRYALVHDESFRMRFDQARAMMFLDHLTHIANAASKSWRASAWLLERMFPECNLRHRTPDAEEDPFNREPPASAEEDDGPRDDVSRSGDRDTTGMGDRDTTESARDTTGPYADMPTPFADSGRATQSTPETDMDLSSFETAALAQAVPSVRRQTLRIPSLPADHPLQTHGEIPPPRNRNALRERIYAENPQGFELDRMIEEETRKELEAQRAAAGVISISEWACDRVASNSDKPPREEQTRKEHSFQNVPQLHTHYPCDPADLYAALAPRVEADSCATACPAGSAPGVAPPSG